MLPLTPKRDPSCEVQILHVRILGWSHYGRSQTISDLTLDFCKVPGPNSMIKAWKVSGVCCFNGADDQKSWLGTAVPAMGAVSRASGGSSGPWEFAGRTTAVPPACCAGAEKLIGAETGTFMCPGRAVEG